MSPENHRDQAEVRRATTIPIASGEREFTRYGFQSLLAHDALDIAQPAAFLNAARAPNSN